MPGHYIHGPKTVIHVLKHFNRELINEIFAKELDELFQDSVIDRTDLGVVSNSYDKETLLLLDFISKSKSIKTKMISEVCSEEWPAVIVLLTLRDYLFINMEGDKEVSADLEHMYLALSRARVKCTVIMFPLDGLIFDDFHRMRDLLNELEDYVHIRRYPLTPLTTPPTRSFAGPFGFDKLKAFCAEKFPDWFVR